MDHRPVPVLSPIDKFHLSITKVIILLIPLLPLFISTSLVFPFITGKNFAFRILVELAAVLWLSLSVFNKEYRPGNSVMVISVLTFTFIVGVADLFGINPYNSFWSNYERMEGYVTVLHLALYFMMIKSIFRTEKDWKVFFNVFVIGSVAVSLHIFFEPLSTEHSLDYLLEYGKRHASTIGNPPFLASYLLLSIFLAIISIFINQKTYVKSLYLFPILLNCVVIYITASRGAIIGAFSAAAVIGTWLVLRKFRDSNKKSFRKVAVLFLLGLFVIASVLFWASTNADLIKKDKTISRFMMMFNSDPSVGTRLLAWELAWKGIKKKPILGWGQENFIGVYTVNTIPLEGRNAWVDRAHNIILDWLVHTGIVGLFSYLAMYAAAFYMLWNNLRKKIFSSNETLILLTAIISYFIQNLFTFDSINTYLIFFALLAYIDSAGSIRSTPNANLKNNVLPYNNKILSLSIYIIAVSMFTFIAYYINYLPIRKIQTYSNIVTSSSKYTSYSTLLDDFNRALSFKTFGDNYIRDNMLGVSMQILKNQLYTKEGATNLVQRTVEELDKETAINDIDLHYYNDVVAFYEEIAAYEPSYISKVEKLIEKIRRINPDNGQVDMFTVDILFIKKDYEGAYAKLKKLVEQYPNHSNCRFKLALATILTSRTDEVKKALESYKSLWIHNNEDTTSGNRQVFSFNQLRMLAKAQMEVKNYSYAIRYYKEILSMLSSHDDIRLFKEDFQNLTEQDKINMESILHMEIARIYKLLNDNENAEREEKEAKQIDLETLSNRVIQFINLLTK